MNKPIYHPAEAAYRRGDYHEMIRIATAGLIKTPKDEYFHYLIAVGEHELGQLKIAASFAQKAIKLNKNASNARLLLTTILQKMGRMGEAEAQYKILCANYPDNEVVASNFAFYLNDLKRFDESLKILVPFINKGRVGEAIAINIGNSLRGIGNLKEARRYYQHALTLNGKFWAGARANLAVITLEEGNLSEAMADLVDLHDRGVAPKEAYLNLAVIALRLQKIEESVKWILEGESRGVDNVGSVVVYALAQAKLGNVEDAITKIRDYVTTGESDFSLLCVWLTIAQKNCLYDDLRLVIPRITSAIEAGKTQGATENDLFNLLACEGIHPTKHLKIATDVAKRLRKDRLPIPLQARREGRLRIGYLCADFRDHPIAHLIIGVLKNHDREKFEVYGYDTGNFDDSIYRYRSIAYLEHYTEVRELNFEQLANRIVSDGIDILVDLIGYTENCRPQTLCFKPAPVIISYLGYVGSTGMGVVDYIIADKIVLPPINEAFFSEKPIYMPRCYQATDGTLVVETLTRAELGLPENQFVYASLNNAYKLNARYVALWSTILMRCPTAVIWLLASAEAIRSNVIKEFERNGIDKQRIFFFQRQSKARFLGALACADLFLDSSPYNAGTTASDALYAGCPVITLPGETYSSRMAASIVSHAGLPELVCLNEKEYVDKAVRICTDTYYREMILVKTEAAKVSRLFDTSDATRCLESGFVAAHERYLSKQPAASIHVADTGWVSVPSYQRPFAGYRLTLDEVMLIEQKLTKTGGVSALAHFRQLVSLPSGFERGHGEIQPSSQGMLPVEFGKQLEKNYACNTNQAFKKGQEVDDAEEVLNFFNPVFWGVKDPEIFADLMRIAAKQTTAYHFADNMFVFQRNNSMLHDKPFMASWEKNAVSSNDKAIIWRRYIKVVAGFHCSHLEGDFVECGAYQGTGAKTVIDCLGGPAFPKTFWLYDMFEHNDEMVNHAMPGHGPQLYDEVCKRFEGYHNVKIYKGLLPDVFREGSPQTIAYLHIDLNQAPAEIATLEALFDRVVPGGLIILDDYEMFYYRAQKYAEDEWFAKRGYKVFPLPTSQGVVIKR